MIVSVVVLGLVTAQRLSELIIARRNTRALIARGGHEIGAAHYPLIVLLHALWLAGLWLLAWNLRVDPVWLGVFLGLEGLRLWVLTTLGPRWTTRIIVLPDEPLVAKGPYRFVRHPNYLVVIGEIAVLPLAFGLVWYALAFSVLNAGVLFVRIRTENRTLESR
jgi:methyltransferase